MSTPDWVGSRAAAHITGMYHFSRDHARRYGVAVREAATPKAAQKWEFSRADLIVLRDMIIRMKASDTPTALSARAGSKMFGVNESTLAGAMREGKCVSREVWRTGITRVAEPEDIEAWIEARPKPRLDRTTFLYEAKFFMGTLGMSKKDAMKRIAKGYQVPAHKVKFRFEDAVRRGELSL